MRIVLQRVKEAQVSVDKEIVGKIGQGLLILLGIHSKDQTSHIEWMISKLLNLRIFQDDEGKLNRSLLDIKGEVLVVSQFTLYGNCNNGRRPDFLEAASPEIAEPIYQKFVEKLNIELGKVQTGQFGAYMQVSLINDGPITMIIESKK